MRQQDQDRHGDVQVQECEEPAALGLRVPAGERGIALALGEATGHAHRIEESDAAELYDAPANDVDGVRYLHVVRTTALRHEEHGPINLAPGWYRIGIKRQYSEDEQGWAPVAD